MKRTAPRISDWMWPLLSPLRIQSSRNGIQAASASTPTTSAGGGEHPQRLVAGVDAQDREPVAPHVGAGRVEQPRLARLRVGLDLDLVDRDQHLAGLDQALQRVGEVVDDEQAAAPPRGCRRGSRRWCRRSRCRRGAARPSCRAAAAPSWRRRSARSGRPGGRRRPCRPRRRGSAPSSFGDVGAAVLVVGVGVDDDVGAELEAGVEAGLEAGREALVVGQADDVLDPVLAGDLDRAVGRAVVDHQQLDLVDARRSARGRSAIVAGSVASSLRQGIWMISFMGAVRVSRALGARVLSRGGGLRAGTGPFSAPPRPPARGAIARYHG